MKFWVIFGEKRIFRILEVQSIVHWWGFNLQQVTEFSRLILAAKISFENFVLKSDVFDLRDWFQS
jgi:hypothetical protein